MTLKESLLAVRSGWKLVVVAVAVGVLLSGFMAWRTEPQYISSARLFVAARTDTDDPEELFQRNQIATQRLASYVELVSSDATAEEARKVLGDDAAEYDAVRSVTATTVPETVIIDLQVVATDPEASAAVASAYAEAVPLVIARVEEVGDDEAAQVEVTQIAGPGPGIPVKPSLVRELLLGGVLGFVLGSGFVVARGALRRSPDATPPATSQASGTA